MTLNGYGVSFFAKLLRMIRIPGSIPGSIPVDFRQSPLDHEKRGDSHTIESLRSVARDKLTTLKVRDEN